MKRGIVVCYLAISYISKGISTSHDVWCRNVKRKELRIVQNIINCHNYYFFVNSKPIRIGYFYLSIICYNDLYNLSFMYCVIERFFKSRLSIDLYIFTIINFVPAFFQKSNSFFHVKIANIKYRNLNPTLVYRD